MANWLSRATEGFRKAPPPAPEPYSVRCDCGGTVTGVRANGPQRPSCPNCGRQVFVLPVNIYPLSIRPKKPAPKTSTTDSPPAQVPSTAPVGKPGRGQATQAESTPEPKPEGILVESRTRLLTPFRMIVVAITCVGALTGWGLWHRYQIESAKVHVLAANEAGMKALNEGDFATAAKQLTRARDAVDVLGRTDPEANTIRRYCREAIAGHGLSGSGLFELLTEYVTDSRSGRPRFGTVHRDSWLIIDATIANPDAKGPCILDMPMILEETKFRIEVDSSTIREAAAKPESGGRVIFAAQMSEIRPGKKSNAVLVLNGKTAFLWTTPETYILLGYAESRPEDLQITRDLLGRQLEQTEASK